MAAGVIPIIELAANLAPELPKLVEAGVTIIKDLGMIFHHAPGGSLTPAQTAQVQAMALAGMKTTIQTSMPGSAATVTDAQLQAFIQTLYMILNHPAVAAPVAPVAASLSGPTSADWAPVIAALPAVLNLFTKLAVPQVAA